MKTTADLQLWVAIVVTVWLAIQVFASLIRRDSADTPIHDLRRRLAKGTIDDAEFWEKYQALQQTRPKQGLWK